MRMNKHQQAEAAEWCALHLSCAICWWPDSDRRRELHLHHICGGSSRKHVVENYCRLCSSCHDLLHAGSVVGNYPALYNRTVLWAKRESDPENYNPELLAELRNRKHLGYEPEEPHRFYLDERQANLHRSRKP